jgi:hypothetical protein
MSAWACYDRNERLVFVILASAWEPAPDAREWAFPCSVLP